MRVEVRFRRSRGLGPFAPGGVADAQGRVEVRKAKASTRPFLSSSKNARPDIEDPVERPRSVRGIPTQLGPAPQPCASVLRGPGSLSSVLLKIGAPWRQGAAGPLISRA
jgi:hypothetical protein